MAERIVIGIANFKAHEKSTINTDNAFVMLRVNNHASIVPKNVYGTNLSAKCSALLSTADFSFSYCSIMVIIFSYLVLPDTSLTFIVSSPSSITVPA